MELYNLKDKKYKEYIRGLSLANIPINFYTFKINHITVRDVLSIGEERYLRMMLPFMITKGYALEDESVNVELIDLVTSNKFYDYHDDFIMALSLFFNVSPEEIRFDCLDGVHNEIIIKDKLYINSYLFNQLRDILLFTNNIKELTNSNSNKKRFKSNEEYNKRLDVFYKGKEEYEKVKKDMPNNEIVSMFDFVVHLQEVISYENILRLNIYQLYNSFKRYNQREDYRFNRNTYSNREISLKNVEIPTYLKIIIDDNK